MATEILVNDGGAPARILPFLAGEAISAGEALTASATADMTAVLATAGNINIIGFALTDAAVGDMCSVITGRKWSSCNSCQNLRRRWRSSCSSWTLESPNHIRR